MAYCLCVPFLQEAISTWVTSAGICMRRKHSLTQGIPLGPGSCEVDVVGSVGRLKADSLEAAAGEETKFVSPRVRQSVLPWRCPVEFSVDIVAQD